MLFTLQEGLMGHLNDLNRHMNEYCEQLSRLPPREEPAADVLAPKLALETTDPHEFAEACREAAGLLREIPRGTPLDGRSARRASFLER